MANVTITELPQAGAITGTEAVPIVQNGQTVQTTASALAGSPVQTQTFLTLNQEPTLANSRRLSAGTGVGLVDGGAQSTLQITLNAASGSLEAASNGLIAKTASNAVTARSIVVSGSGLGVSNGDGISGNPTLALTGLPSSLAGLSGSGFLCLPNNGTVSSATLTGTAGQITVTGGDGTSGNPTFAIATNPALPGNAGAVMPSGSTAQRSGSPVNGTLRYNSDIGLMEGYLNSSWQTLAAGSSGVISISTGTGLTGGPITSTGTISIANTAVTAGSYTLGNFTVNAQGQLTAASSTTAVSNAQLANSSLTVGTTNIALGATSLTLAGLTTVTVTQDPTSAYELTTKQYVDGLVSTGLFYHEAVQAATTGTLASITGGTVTYNNGTAGVGATLTLSVALTVLDGYTLLNTNRILVKDQADQTQNGVYTWATGGTVLTRSTDTDTYGTGTGDLSQNDYFFVQNGTVNKGVAFVCTTVGTIVFGTTAITFAEFSTSQVYTGTSPIQVTGTVISLNTVPTANGGTNLTSFTANGVVYASSTSALATGSALTFNGTSLSTTGQVVSTQTGSATDGAGQFYLNGATSNRVEFSAVGTGAPAFTTRSAGTKLLLYPALSGSQVDYAMGINAATLWSSVPVNSSSFYFKWYGGETQVASLDGAGAFTAIGGISGGTF